MKLWNRLSGVRRPWVTRESTFYFKNICLDFCDMQSRCPWSPEVEMVEPAVHTGLNVALGSFTPDPQSHHSWLRTEDSGQGRLLKPAIVHTLHTLIWVTLNHTDKQPVVPFRLEITLNGRPGGSPLSLPGLLRGFLNSYQHHGYQKVQKGQLGQNAQWPILE